MTKQIHNKKLELNWFAVQPTSYNYYFYSAIKNSDQFNFSVYYSLIEFNQLPYKESFFDPEDYFFNTKLGLDFKILRKSFSRNVFIVYSGWEGKTKLLSIFLRSIFNLPYAIWTDSIDSQQFKKSNLSNFFRKQFFKGATRIFTTGIMGVNNLKKVLGPDHDDRIVNLPYFNRIPNKFKPAKDKLEQDKFNILVLARLVEYKGVDLVLEAVKLLDNKKIKLYIGGIGEQEENLKTKSKLLNIDDQVAFCGFLDEDEMYDLQQECHVFVHAARKHEPFGLVVIDNLSVGIPVIATNVTGAAVDRIVDGYNGFVIEPDNVVSLVERINFLMENPLKLIEMSSNARLSSEQWPVERGVSIIEKEIVGNL